MRFQTTVFCMVAFLILASSARGQAPVDPAGRTDHVKGTVQRLPSQKYLRVTTRSGIRVEGRLYDTLPDSFRITGNGLQEIPYSDVRELKTGRGFKGTMKLVFLRPVQAVAALPLLVIYAVTGGVPGGPGPW